MSRLVRAALTETRNAFSEMPKSVSDLGSLAGKLNALREANVAHHIELLESAKRQGCQIVGFGELFAGPYFALAERELWRDLAEDALDGPTVRAICQAARELQLIVIAPIYELDTGSGKRFNTAVVIDETGTVLGRYRKTHIPCGVNERASFHETFYYERSDGGPAGYFPVFETSLGKIGVGICYDRHFEGVMSSLAANGAELVFSPAVTFGEKSRRMWELEFEVDAARHSLFIGGSNRKGCEPPWDVEYFGASHFAGPDGKLPNLSERAELIISDVDLDSLKSADSSGWDLGRDCRPEIYRV